MLKNTGVKRKVDELGRIVIPIELRNKLNILEDDTLDIYIDRNSIVLKKEENTCMFCGSTKNLVSFKEKQICHDCIKNIAR
ncbi:MAG: AbrB/MazE/SpoVT family DNA-binding domain-containing protein [Clostridia bacterium]